MEKVLEDLKADPNADVESWLTGVEGEQATAVALSSLGPEWKVFHSIPIGTTGRDIDHLAIGPTGVYVINSKSHPGANIRVTGDVVIYGRRGWQEPKAALRDAELVAQRLRRPARDVKPILSMWRVRSLEVWSDAAVPTMWTSDVVEHIKRMRRVLAANEIEWLAARAADPAT